MSSSCTASSYTFRISFRSIAFVFLALATGHQSSAKVHTPSTSQAAPSVRINEFMSLNHGIFQVNVGDESVSPDWVELWNQGPQSVSLEGWSLCMKALRMTCKRLPNGASIGPNGFLLLLMMGSNHSQGAVSSIPNVPVLSLPVELHSSVLQLLGPDNTTVSTVGPLVPRQMVNVSFGIPSDASSNHFTFLQSPTPGMPNAAALATGPFILQLTRDRDVGDVPPGQDVPINITVAPAPGESPISSVYLAYSVNLGPETKLSTSHRGTSKNGDLFLYEVAIPHSAFKAGDLLTWRALAKDSAGKESSLPELDAGQSSSFGTVITSPEANSSLVPVLHWFTSNPSAALTEAGSDGSTLFFRGRISTGVSVRRRGVTSLAWPKPKLKFIMPGEDFRYEEEAPKVKEFDLQSFWFELGERSYMKEVLGLNVMHDAGVMSPISFHVEVRQNGKFFGLFAFVEVVDEVFLKRNHLPQSGPLFKAFSGELSNLRWDLPASEMHWYWHKGNRKDNKEDWVALEAFSRGLAGGGPLTRSEFLMESLDLPQIINDMAVETLLNNMDRCTKNYFMYRDPLTARWYRFPWDLDASFGQDNGLGGKPGSTYCVLTCPQWNSPLYCDANHTQDMVKVTPWGVTTVTFDNFFQGGHDGQRRLLIQQVANIATLAAPAAETKFAAPASWSQPDVNFTSGRSLSGALGTYNHLTAAILDVAPTRAMYLRRLRTLADQFLGQNKIAQMANETLQRIHTLADEDAALWKSGISVTRGFQQITTEFLPTRREQLLGSLYGPNGSQPLLPPAQSANPLVELKAIVLNASAPQEGYAHLHNPDAEEAIDVSGWRLVGGATTILPAGTVIPAQMSLYLSPNITAFQRRTSEPRGSMGLFVLGGLEVPPTHNIKSAVHLYSSTGALVSQI